ncbi:hypothetical protein ES319_D12G114700v1 [Gossypium barbadense]|uniref:Hydrophobic seed protein domain-containing protein n=2 Tax=Gossypium TaxID=3633 RepID=A0A5J5NXF7_GOSBA|nr:hypothetical protein ES319_D12G114700v1 [Gossypium barbadense]TYG40774.1 hypothetical protein ES288_D12G121000v1 [Gossypium darwinii]
MAFNCCNAAAIFMLFFTCVSSHNVVPCPPKTTPSMPPSVAAKCPKDTLKFGVCGSWLGLAHEVIGTPPSKECCVCVLQLRPMHLVLRLKYLLPLAC